MILHLRIAPLLPSDVSCCVLLADEIDAIGTKRFDSETSGDREVQRTMLELLNQLDGFGSDENIKVRLYSRQCSALCTCALHYMMVMTTVSMQVIAATNRADILDPALMRSGRLDRKVEFPHPNEDARSKILQIHSRKMNVAPDVNFDELARSTDDFNAAQLKVRAPTVCHGQNCCAAEVR